MKYAAKRCRCVFAFLTMALLVAAWFMPACFATDAVEANGTISQAEYDLNSAYAAVTDAEAAGADISELLNTLNGAADSLSRAYASFRTGDYDDASRLAADCSHILEGVITSAASLKADAEKAQDNRFFLYVVRSSIGLVLLLVLGLLGWELVKKRYYRRVFDIKPQMEDTQ